MKKLIIVLLILIFGLTACSTKWYGEGIVVDKKYDHGHTYFISCGKSSLCPAYQPECYRLKVRADDGEHEGCVRPKVWEDARVGQYIKITEQD